METYPNHTQSQILNELRKSGGLQKISAIAEMLNISGETVRRNVKRLVDMGAVAKSHGSVQLIDATAHDEGNFQQRLDLNAAAKRAIAAYVASMIPNGSSLFMDVGSTTAYIADELRGHRQLTIVTNSVHVAYHLSSRNENRVYIAGGELRNRDGGVFGADAMEFVANFHTDFALLSTTGLDAKNGFTLFDLEEAKFSRRIMTSASTCIVACDSAKFEREAPITIGNPSIVDHLVSDAEPSDALRAALEGWGIKLHIAHKPL